jgi:hypothetical protein
MMSIQPRKIEANIIDIEAHAVDGRQRGHAARFDNETYTTRQDRTQDFAHGYTGPTSLGGATRNAHDNYNFNFQPESADCYAETIIAFHHSKRGVRFAMQASTRNTLIIIFVVVMLISRPGVLEFGFNLIKSMVSIR